MIGPITPGATFLTSIDYGTAPTSPGVRLLAADGSTAIARSTTGIIDMGSSIRAKVMTAPGATGFYLAEWDDADGIRTPDEAVWVNPILTNILAAAIAGGSGGGGGGGGLPIVGDANGTLLGKTFLIKRGDTKPYIRRQLVDTNGNAIVLDGSETVKFTMRVSTDVAMAGGAKVHATADIINAALGIVEYKWAAADTNTTTYTETSTLGRFADVPYAAEFEVNYADLSVETFPQADYIAVSIPPDLDPGITP